MTRTTIGNISRDWIQNCLCNATRDDIEGWFAELFNQPVRLDVQDGSLWLITSNCWATEDKIRWALENIDGQSPKCLRVCWAVRGDREGWYYKIEFFTKEEICGWLEDSEQSLDQAIDAVVGKTGMDLGTDDFAIDRDHHWATWSNISKTLGE